MNLQSILLRIKYPCKYCKNGLCSLEIHYHEICSQKRREECIGYSSIRQDGIQDKEKQEERFFKKMLKELEDTYKVKPIDNVYDWSNEMPYIYIYDEEKPAFRSQFYYVKALVLDALSDRKIPLRAVYSPEERLCYMSLEQIELVFEKHFHPNVHFLVFPQKEKMMRKSLLKLYGYSSRLEDEKRWKLLEALLVYEFLQSSYIKGVLQTNILRAENNKNVDLSEQIKIWNLDIKFIEQYLETEDDYEYFPGTITDNFFWDKYGTYCDWKHFPLRLDEIF